MIPPFVQLWTRVGVAAFMIGAVQAESARDRLSPEAIDAVLVAAAAKHEVMPAPRCTDAEFIRRLSLDVRGVIPTVEETIEFISDKSPEKRPTLVRKYLDDPLRGAAWAAYWDKLLVGNLTETVNNQNAAMRAKSTFKTWVEDEFNANRPLDEFAKRVITAAGPADVEPSTLPMVRWDGSAPDMAGTMSRVFLGRQIQCAQCHDHPYDETLTQEKFWESAAFFDRTKVIPYRNMEGLGRGRQVIEKVSGETRIPDSSPPVTVQPAWIDGTPGPEGKTAHRREAFAEMMTSHDRRQFARNFVNRLWGHYMGRGFLEPVDDWQTPFMKPDHPELLENLTDEFIASGLDVRHMEEIILNTDAYQRSSATDRSLSGKEGLFAVAQVRPLNPEQLLASIDRAVNLSSQARSDRGEGFRSQLRERYLSQFVFLFGNDEMEESSNFDANVAQALFLYNDPTINKAISTGKGSILDRVLASAKSPRDQVDYLYLATVNRRPTDPERTQLATMLEQAGDASARRAVLEDLLWALINSAEFRTNH